MVFHFCRRSEEAGRPFLVRDAGSVFQGEFAPAWDQGNDRGCPCNSPGCDWTHAAPQNHEATASKYSATVNRVGSTKVPVSTSRNNSVSRRWAKALVHLIR